MISLPKLFFFFLLAFHLQNLPAQDSLRKNVKYPFTSKQFYKNGNLKSISKTNVKHPRNSDLFNYYTKTKVVTTDYDSITKKKIEHSIRITKVGIGGKHCYEYFYKRMDYDLNGKKLKFEKSRCDKNRYKHIDYVNGKKDFILIQRPRKRKR